MYFSFSAEHSLTVNPSEPAIVWLNDTIPSATVDFDFDGACDVMLSAFPDRLSLNRLINGTTLSVNIATTADTSFDEYMVTLSPFQENRTYNNVTHQVFYGYGIEGLQVNTTVNTNCIPRFK